MFAEWQSLPIGSSFGPAEIASDEPHHLVACAILEALENGRIQAYATINIANLPSKPQSDDDLLSDDMEDRCWHRDYFIDAQYWLHLRDTRLNWILSEADIPISYINVGPTAPLKRARPDLSPKSEYTQAIHIIDSDVAFGRLFSREMMPTEDMFRLYAKFNSRLNDELVMLGWRYLAIERPSFDESPHAAIIAHMRKRLGERGINEENTTGMSRLALSNLTTRLLKQWKAQSSDQPIWINSSGKAPYSAPRLRPRRPSKKAEAPEDSTS